MTVGERIKNARKALGMTQVQLADKIGESKQTIYKYEKNKVTNIPIDKIELIADALGVTPVALMGYEMKPAPNDEGGLKYPADYDKLNEINRAIVDRLIADLAKGQSSD